MMALSTGADQDSNAQRTVVLVLRIQTPKPRKWNLRRKRARYHAAGRMVTARSVRERFSTALSHVLCHPTPPQVLSTFKLDNRSAYREDDRCSSCSMP
jgi:hypothetical protein